jgi:hypothetical protein
MPAVAPPPAPGTPVFHDAPPPSVPQSGQVRRVTLGDSGRPSYVGDVRASIPGVDRPPPSVPVVDPVEAQLRAAADEAVADREWAKSRRSRWPLILLGLILLLGGVGGSVAYASLQVETLGEAFQPARPLLFSTSIAVPSEAEPAVNVALVLSPIDAHVYREGRDLGSMPVEIPVKKGEIVDVEVRRDGYFTKKLALDGSKTKVTVRLAAGGGHASRAVTPGPPGASGAVAPPPPQPHERDEE